MEMIERNKEHYVVMSLVNMKSTKTKLIDSKLRSKKCRTVFDENRIKYKIKGFFKQGFGLYRNYQA